MKYLAALAVSVIAGNASATVITQWNFNGTSATTVPGGALSPTASTGTGTASLLGGITSLFSSGVANGGSSDPVTTSPPNFGWQTTTYPAIGAGNGTAGVQFMVSTLGFTGITINFDTRNSNTSSRWVRLDYTTNGGGSWVNGTAAANTIYEGTAGDTWFNLRLGNLTGASAANNNAQFGFRIVTVFGPSTGPYVDGGNYTQYFSANSASTYAGSGTLRWDMVTVNGSAVPEPATMAVIGLGLAAIVRRRRKN